MDPTGHMSYNELVFFFGKDAAEKYKHEADPTPSKSSSSSSSSSSSKGSSTSSSSSGSSKSSSSSTVVLVDPLVGVIFDVSSSEAAYWLNSGCVRLDDGGEFVFGNIINTSKYADKINIAAGSNVTVTNQKDRKIGTITTGDNSKTTVNNKGIIDTIKTGKDSSLILNNYESGYIRNITGGNISDKDSLLGINVTNYGQIDYIQTGVNSTNEVFDYDDGNVGLLVTGDGNDSYTNVKNSSGQGASHKISPKDAENIKKKLVDVNKILGSNGKLPYDRITEYEKYLNSLKTEAEKEYFINGLKATGKLTVTIHGKSYEIKNKETGKTDFWSNDEYFSGLWWQDTYKLSKALNVLLNEMNSTGAPIHLYDNINEHKMQTINAALGLSGNNGYNHLTLNRVMDTQTLYNITQVEGRNPSGDTIDFFTLIGIIERSESRSEFYKEHELIKKIVDGLESTGLAESFYGSAVLIGAGMNGTVKPRINTPEYNFENIKKYYKHYNKHKVEFGNITEFEYLQKANNFINSSGKNVLSRTASNGDILQFNTKTNEFSIVTKEGIIRTYHKLNPEIHKQGTNLDYWNGPDCNY